MLGERVKSIIKCRECFPQDGERGWTRMRERERERESERERERDRNPTGRIRLDLGWPDDRKVLALSALRSHSGP